MKLHLIGRFFFTVWKSLWVVWTPVISSSSLIKNSEEELSIRYWKAFFLSVIDTEWLNLSSTYFSYLVWIMVWRFALLLKSSLINKPTLTAWVLHTIKALWDRSYSLHSCSNHRSLLLNHQLAKTYLSLYQQTVCLFLLLDW